MPFEPVRLAWPGSRAILLVHGIGNALPGYYGALRQLLEQALGPRAAEFAIYELYYDALNDWFREKTRLAEHLQLATALVRGKAGDGDLADALAEYAADILWPIFSLPARTAISTAYVAQLQQLVLDGAAAGHPARRQQISIICHSLGCFHTYEALHAAATDSALRLTPGTHKVRFANVIFMASPVQLIRTVAMGLGPLAPNRGLASISPRGLAQPTQRLVKGGVVPSVRRWASITGELDPVGGYFLRQRADWAYMNVDGQVSIVDPQRLLSIPNEAALVTVLRGALRQGHFLDLSLENPHSWEGYVSRHTTELAQWLTA